MGVRSVAGLKGSEGGFPRTQGGFHYAFLIVAACLVLTGIPGSMPMNCAGSFFTPVSSYFGVPKAQFTLYFSIMNISSMLFLPFAGKLMGRCNLRALLSVACLAEGLVFVAMSRFGAIWMFYVAGAILGLTVTPVLFLAAPQLIDNWCRAKVGFFVGLAMAASGIGGMLFNLLAGYLCALAPDGWRIGYLVYGLIILFVALPFTFFVVRTRPAEKGLRRYGEAGSKALESSLAANGVQDAVVYGVSANRATRTIAFAAIAAFSFILSIEQTTYQFFASYCYTFDDAAITMAAGLIPAACMGSQAVAKVLLGMLSDHKPRTALLIALGGGIVGLLILWLFPLGVAPMVLGAVVYGALFSANSVLAPLMIRCIFGSRCYAEINSRRAVFSTLSFAFAAAFWGVVVDLPNGYAIMFAISIVLALVAAALGLFAYSKTGAYEQTAE